MRKIAGAVALVLATTLGAAACGVDKKGTADNLIKAIEKQAARTMSADQKSCLTDLVKSYSDGDLRKLSDGKLATDDPLSTGFQEKLATCVGS